MSICTHPHMCTHSPLGIHMLLLIRMQKIHWACLFVNRKCLDLCPDKGSYCKHKAKLHLCLCSSQKLISSSLCTYSRGSRCWKCRNTRGQSNIAHCYPPRCRDTSPIWTTVRTPLHPALGRVCVRWELLPATRRVSRWETGLWSNGAWPSAVRTAVLHPKQACQSANAALIFRGVFVLLVLLGWVSSNW